MTTDEVTVTSMRLTAVFAKPGDAQLFVRSLNDPDALWYASDIVWPPNRSRVTWTGHTTDPTAYFEAACTAVGYWGSTQRHKATVAAEFDGDGGPVMWGPRACRYIP